MGQGPAVWPYYDQATTHVYKAQLENAMSSVFLYLIFYLNRVPRVHFWSLCSNVTSGLAVVRSIGGGYVLSRKISSYY